MAVTIIAETGEGLEDANSYVTLAEAETYIESRLYADAWTDATTDNKNRALVMATRYIDQQFVFNGFKLTQEQALQWPRHSCPDPDSDFVTVGLAGAGPYLPEDEVPKAVKDATCEMALQLLKSDRSAAAPGEGLKSLEIVGALKLEFDRATAADPLTQDVMRALAKYGQPVGGGGFSVVKLSRA